MYKDWKNQPQFHQGKSDVSGQKPARCSVCAMTTREAFLGSWVSVNLFEPSAAGLRDGRNPIRINRWCSRL